MITNLIKKLYLTEKKKSRDGYGLGAFVWDFYGWSIESLEPGGTSLWQRKW